MSLPTDSFAHNAVFVDAQDHILVIADEKLQMLMATDHTPSGQHTWKTLTSCSWISEYCRISLRRSCYHNL